MYKHKLLQELETKFDNRPNMYPEYELRCLCYCLELLLNYGTLQLKQINLYRKLAQQLQKILQSKMYLLAEDVQVIYVYEGWKIVENNIHRLKKELNVKSNIY